MSNISLTGPLEQPTQQAVILPFKLRSQTNEQFSPCIFCGKTVKIQRFKGKTVCISCLHEIPEIFSFG
ncbi:hypothetical protein [Desulfosporosinus youngiae]|uniref:Uncharacterized protein n=1 Tax=Desulfosporosinus youngiae DSM 17734 TaxID=768710 RepID=H5XYM6_9FIRM|nr:hypothetical protein [Desulfosporosinus youngiae]EHQ91582.1 hypothetical protein DesyoDRAFT_4628 [Desulfosporosinus youngiae DSM 17734]